MYIDSISQEYTRALFDYKQCQLPKRLKPFTEFLDKDRTNVSVWRYLAPSGLPQISRQIHQPQKAFQIEM